MASQLDPACTRLSFYTENLKCNPQSSQNVPKQISDMTETTPMI